MLYQVTIPEVTKIYRMVYVIILWILLLVVLIAHLYTVFCYKKSFNKIKSSDGYSKEVIQNTNMISAAIMLNKIKQHLLTNSAEVYDSGKELEHYRSFLKSPLMKDITNIKEKNYHG